MKNTSLIILCGAAVLAPACSTLHRSDKATLQGAWEGYITQGNPQHRCLFTISGTNFEFGDETDTNVWYKGTFTLREDTNPRQYIAMIGECPFPQYVGKTSMAIYRFEGDTLTITGNEPGKAEAPSTFDNPDFARMELKRK